MSQQWVSGAWVNTTCDTATYDKNGNRDSLTRQDWINNAWTNYGREIYSYYPSQNPSTTLQQAWISNGWVNHLLDSYTYDAQDYPRTKLEQSWTGGVWVNSVQDSYTCDEYGNTKNVIEMNWKSNTWQNSRWIQYTWEKLSDNFNVLKPIKGETLLADASYTIEWKSSGIDSIKIEYSIDNGKTFQKITRNVTADAGRYVWHVPDVLSSKCKLVLTNLNDPNDTAVISNFRIKGYILTRIKANGDFEAYDPAVHGWQFKNDNNMWPADWYDRFCYICIDPNTKARYPDEFTAIPYAIQARTYDFPDWPLFTQAFGINQCYESIAPPTYSQSALLYWNSIKHVHNGSCFGFAISSLLEFDSSTAFRTAFPQLGSYTNLIELPLNDYRRLVINQLYIYQFGYAAITFEKTRKMRTPRETLQDVKDNLFSSIQNHCGLALYHKYTLGGGSGGHEVVPYAIRKIPNTSQSELLVYDSNCPSGNCAGGVKPAVIIDSLYNTWNYPPLKWGSGMLNLGMYLDSPANTYLLNPVLPNQSGTKSGMIGEQPFLQVMNTNSAAINISNLLGNSIGFADSTVVDNMLDGFPIIPKTGTSEAPIGYVVPDGSYSIRMNAFRDSIASVAVFGNSSVFNYWRGDAVNNQTDLLTFDGGMGFSNPDTKTKTVNVEVINRSADGENDFKIMNFGLVENDKVRLESTDINRAAFINEGPAKTYDLNIVQARESSSGQIKHDRIPIPAHSTHFIVSDLQDLSTDSVKILEDKGNTGIISDSLFIANQATGMGKPLNNAFDGQNSLLQNYPNPFTSKTTIKYKVAEPGSVSLKVFDVMGTEVANLVNEQKPVGEYLINWDAAGFGSGIYFCRLQAGTFTDTKKLVLQK